MFDMEALHGEFNWESCRMWLEGTGDTLESLDVGLPIIEVHQLGFFADQISEYELDEGVKGRESRKGCDVLQDQPVSVEVVEPAYVLKLILKHVLHDMREVVRFVESEVNGKARSSHRVPSE